MLPSRNTPAWTKKEAKRMYVFIVIVLAAAIVNRFPPQ